jgi:hypothetical protein
MIHTAKAVRTLQAVALTVGIALLLWGIGLPTLFRTAEAVSITDASDTLSESAPGVGSVHTIAFTTDNGLIHDQTIVLSFEGGPGFDLTGLAWSDISLTIGGIATTTQQGGSGAGIWGVATNTPDGQSITLTAPSDMGVASSSDLVITVGSSTNTMIINPSATTSYSVGIGGTMQDSGQVRVAIIENVVVTATVNTSLQFSVTGLGQDAAVNGTSTTATSTNTTVPFGVVSHDEIVTLAQRLNVTTNASNGYTVTVEETKPLQSSTGAIIDGFVDGSNTTTPTTWQAPSATINQLNTYGHWGLTSDDTVAGRANEFGSNEWVSASTSPVIVMGHTGPADGLTNGVGSTTVGYQVEISALQEAGDDYNTTLRYVATPVF